MEKNLHFVQDEQINSLKVKCDQISNEKDELEREIEILRFQLNTKNKEIKELKTHSNPNKFLAKIDEKVMFDTGDEIL